MCRLRLNYRLWAPVHAQQHQWYSQGAHYEEVVIIHAPIIIGYSVMKLDT